MNERIIKIKNIDPKELFGLRNKNLDFIKSSFPKLKIITRGNEIKVFGDESLLIEFESKIEIIFNYFLEYNSISLNEIEALIKSNSINDIKTSNKSHGAILHGVGGKVKALKERQVKRIILTRPAIEAGENLGFLPGDLKEKLDPYMQPLYDALRDMIPTEKLNDYIEKGIIQIAPLAFMRGRTLDNAFVILDEGQNTTHAQMKMFLTRMGKNAKFLLTGDPGQIDLPRRVISGLKEALLILKDVKGVGVILLDDRDVIRHRLVKEVIEAYKNIENLE